MATDINITASPSEMPAMDTLMIGLEKESPFFDLIRRLIKYSKFKTLKFMAKLKV